MGKKTLKEIGPDEIFRLINNIESVHLATHLQTRTPNLEEVLNCTRMKDLLKLIIREGSIIIANRLNGLYSLHYDEDGVFAYKNASTASKEHSKIFYKDALYSSGISFGKEKKGLKRYIDTLVEYCSVKKPPKDYAKIISSVKRSELLERDVSKEEPLGVVKYDPSLDDNKRRQLINEAIILEGGITALSVLKDTKRSKECVHLITCILEYVLYDRIKN